MSEMKNNDLIKKATHAVVTGNSLIPIHDEIMRNELERRELRITGPIDSEAAHLMQVKLAYLKNQSKKPVTIYLNTPGGHVIDGLAIYDSIMDLREDGIKVNIIASGSCMSMGVIIMQAASERCSLKHAQFLLHELHMVTGGSFTELGDRHKEAKRMQEVLNGILLGRSGLTGVKLKELTERRDTYLTAVDAKKYHIIDRII